MQIHDVGMTEIVGVGSVLNRKSNVLIHDGGKYCKSFDVVDFVCKLTMAELIENDIHLQFHLQMKMAEFVGNAVHR